MRVLILSPHFPPSNAADMQRVRLILPYLKGAGVEAEVLAVEPDQVAAPLDGWLVDGLPPEIPVHRVQAMSKHWSRVPGFGSLTFRALRALRRAGDRLLQNAKFDLIYFSTTQFGLHVLGPHWKRKFGIPFVMDYQDPWVSDYYREHPEVPPPGGRLKYRIAEWLSRRQEPRVLQHCSGITSVSAAYPQQLSRRYPWLKLAPSGDQSERATNSHILLSVLPFPGDERDLDRVRHSDIKQSVFDPNDGFKHWVYIGRGGEDMHLALGGLFCALQSLRGEGEHAALSRLRLHFIGTSYAATGRGMKTIEPLAKKFGLQDLVHEQPDRIPYSQTLRCLLDAHALIVPGSDDAGYTASKIYPYLLAGKPLLAIFHQNSSVSSLMKSCGGGSLVEFVSKDHQEDLAARILASLPDLKHGSLRLVPLDWSAFSPYLAQAQASALNHFWTRCVNPASI